MTATMHRREVVEALLKDRKDLLVVAGLGSTASGARWATQR